MNWKRLVVGKCSPLGSNTFLDQSFGHPKFLDISIVSYSFSFIIQLLIIDHTLIIHAENTPVTKVFLTTFSNRYFSNWSYCSIIIIIIILMILSWVQTKYSELSNDTRRAAHLSCTWQAMWNSLSWLEYFPSFLQGLAKLYFYGITRQLH